MTDTEKRLCILDNRIRLLAERMVPLVISKSKREQFARDLEITLPEVSRRVL